MALAQGPSAYGLIEVTYDVLPLIEATLIKQTQQLLNWGAAMVAEKAQELVSTGYPPASAPGEPPHARTGDLLNSIHAVPNSAPLEALVVAEADYAAILEYGGAHVAARPFMAPAVDAVAPQVDGWLAELAAELGQAAA